jgi:hypothetical protein
LSSNDAEPKLRSRGNEPEPRRRTSHRWGRRAAQLLFLSALSFGTARPARAEVLEAPVGGKAIALGARVACELPGGGWSLVPGGQDIKPPANPEAIGMAVELAVAPDRAACNMATRKTITLLAIGDAPVLDAAAVTLDVDAGTLEVRGRNMRGMGLAWRGRSASGVDTCEEPRTVGGVKRCTFSLGHDVSAALDGTELSWLPPGGRRGADVRVFDASGKPVDYATFALTPAKVLVSRLIPEGAVVDLSTGTGEVPLLHPEAVTGVSCTGASCSLSEHGLVVRGLTGLVDSVAVHLTLGSHVVFKHDDRLEPNPTFQLSVSHCPMAVASGPVVRGVDSALVVVRLEGRCAEDAHSLRFVEGTRGVEIVSTTPVGSNVFVVLRVGRVTGPDVAITALRTGPAEVPVAIARTATRAPPDTRAFLEVPGLPRLAFIPSNRGAIVHVAPPGTGAVLVPLPMDGVYAVERKGQSVLVRGNDFAAGIVTLRFAYRSTELPAELRDLDLAVLEEPVGRPIHEVNVPAPLGGTLARPEPLAEVTCGSGKELYRVAPGETARLGYEHRDSCRLIVHRERLTSDYGTQKLALEIDVLDSDGAPRRDAHASQTLILRTGGEALEAWIHGITMPFDRLVVRLAHIADESHYAAAAEMLTTEPALKWTAVFGSGRARLYATPTIPTGLYRFGDAEHSGLLSLNFGVISRLTWLDEDGHEGFLNLEGGVLVIGLAGSESTTGESLTQAAAVLGVGIGIPFANRSSVTEASINLHLWLEHDLATSSSATSGNPWSVIFGPSISIGNIGTNL